MLCVLTVEAALIDPSGTPVWFSSLSARQPDLFIIALFWHMSLQPFFRLRLTEVPVEQRRAPQLIAVFLNVPFRFYLALDCLSIGSPDACSVTVARPTDGTRDPALCPVLKASQLDRAEFLRRTIPNALFLAPFAVATYKIRSLTGSAASNELAGSGLLFLAVPMILTLAPWAVTDVPTGLRGKTSLLSQCAFPYVVAAVITTLLVCTDKSGTWGRAFRDALHSCATFFDISRGSADSPLGSSEGLPKETLEALLELLNLSLPFFAFIACGAYNALIGMLMRIEAERLGLDRPTEAHIEAHRKKNDIADAHNIPTDVHGRRAVALADAELSEKEMQVLVGKAHVALITIGVTLLVNNIVLHVLIPSVADIGCDDYQVRFDLARKLWKIFFLTPFVTVPFIATPAAFFLGGSTRVKHLWSYTERWGVDEQEKRRLKELAQRRKTLAAASKNGSPSSAADAKEGAEVEALLVAEKA